MQTHGPISFDVVTKKVPTFYFIGVSTTKSSIMKVFPIWMNELGHPEVVLEGVDLKIHDEAKAYRQSVAQIKFDPLSLGALVTTHKIDLLSAARDMFEFLDPYAIQCGEVSSISKRDGSLEGHAKDPITAGLSLDDLIGPGYFGRTSGEVLCFGAGGSGLATALHLISKRVRADRPRRFVVVNRSQGRLDNMQKMVNELQTEIHFEFICNVDPARNDRIMSGMPAASVVINSTGMGKDTPGSPVSDSGIFPEDGIAWDFNYRGELDFMHQALAQKERRNLVVEDGWLYFVHGWTQVIAQVLDVTIDQVKLETLSVLASVVRPPKAPGLRR